MSNKFEIRNYGQTGKCFSHLTFTNEKEAREKYASVCITMRNLHEFCEGDASALSVIPHAIQLVTYNANCTSLEELELEKM